MLKKKQVVSLPAKTVTLYLALNYFVKLNFSPVHSNKIALSV